MNSEDSNPDKTGDVSVRCVKCNNDFRIDIGMMLDDSIKCPICGYEMNYLKAKDTFERAHLIGEYKVKPLISNGEWKPPPEMQYPFTVKRTSIDNVDRPYKWVGWIDEFPYIASLEIEEKEEERYPKYNKEPIILTHFPEAGGPLLPRIKRFFEDGNTYFLFDEYVYKKDEIIKKMTVSQTDRKYLTLLFEALPLASNVFQMPMFKVTNDHFIFPTNGKIYPREEKGYISTLIRELKIGSINQDLYDRVMNLLKAHPKQLTLFYGIIGAHITNLLKIENMPLTVSAIGKSDSGKTFTIKTCLKLAYGMGEAYLQDDAIDSAFRHHSIASTTNLPIYIDEARLSDKRKMKSLYSNIRGRPDQTSEVYNVKATFVLSANSDEYMEMLDITEREAVERRFMTYYFSDEDAIPENEKIVGRKIEEELKNSAGGLIYGILEKKRISELKAKYYELCRTYPSSNEKIAVFGAWLMGDENFKPIVENIPEPDIADEFFTAIVSIGIGLKFRSLDMGFEEKKYRGHLNVNPIEGTMKIDTEGVNNFLKSRSMRESLRNLSARSFIKNYLEPKGFVYESNYIDNYKEGNKMVARGPIPEKYRTNMIPPPTLGNARIPTFDINDEKSL